ncbi:MAG: imidazole glycerol phosphate synthase subunit HisH [Solirubrobacteraceae bacterium]|jgi:glutamine amidotransferase
MTARIAIVDYGMGNRRSVQKAFEHVGEPVEVTADHDLLSAADGLVVPGVGAFPRAMHNLRELGLDEVVLAAARAATPVLGICLGMQLLFERSLEHEPTDGLGLIAGEVTPLHSGGLRIPHIGWNEVRFERPSPLTAGLPSSGCAFYHVHSLAARPASPDDVVASTAYGERFATIVAHGTVLGVQFHPEKSSLYGLAMLRNFVELCGGGVAGAPARAPMRA